MMEAAVRCAPAGRLLALVNGAFGQRFANIARACGREVDQLAGCLAIVRDALALLQRRV
jgi:aspartate aminotransferase-like enzyme